MKIIAFYLPQFHSIPENDIWWGKNFTEWTNLKKAIPLFENHNQPRIPKDKNYYNLLDKETKLWQIKIAKKYGIHGFCIYHYWFNGKLMLERPLEQFLDDKELDINFCISWANESWTNAWATDTSELLLEQKYGDQEDWTNHFLYLLPFFKDERYIKINNQPLFIIYRPELIDSLDEMLSLWLRLAKENGLSGIKFAFQQLDFDINSHIGKKFFSYQIEYQPNYVKRLLNSPRYTINNKRCLLIEDYIEAWEKIISTPPLNSKSFPGAFVDWDNTPRRKSSGSLFINVTPELFEKYLTIQIERAKTVYKKEYLFLFAWNEWGEGGYLEPDEKYGYKYLEAIKMALEYNAKKGE